MKQLLALGGLSNRRIQRPSNRHNLFTPPLAVKNISLDLFSFLSLDGKDIHVEVGGTATLLGHELDISCFPPINDPERPQNRRCGWLHPSGATWPCGSS